MGTLKSGTSHSWEANDGYSKLSLDWAGGTAGTGTVSVKIPASGGATSYNVPQTNIAVNQQSGKLTNNTSKTIEYTLS